VGGEVWRARRLSPPRTATTGGHPLHCPAPRVAAARTLPPLSWQAVRHSRPWDLQRSGPAPLAAAVMRECRGHLVRAAPGAWHEAQPGYSAVACSECPVLRGRGAAAAAARRTCQAPGRSGQSSRGGSNRTRRSNVMQPRLHVGCASQALGLLWRCWWAPTTPPSPDAQQHAPGATTGCAVGGIPSQVAISPLLTTNNMDFTGLSSPSASTPRPGARHIKRPPFRLLGLREICQAPMAPRRHSRNAPASLRESKQQCSSRRASPRVCGLCPRGAPASPWSAAPSRRCVIGRCC
jgi:hypothetical protein